ncbi:CaiF/GrlA family transcriptional regulator, partial [Vibrio cholerae]|nr:CaiF/GrlA family transcriptional regulator [Vibrio cholerae]
MGCESVKRPMYLLIADWVKNENRWVTAKEIAQYFDLDHCKVTNIISYILSDVNEINCETKTIPNQLEGRGCQCQRLIRVNTIDSQLYARLG